MDESLNEVVCCNCSFPTIAEYGDINEFGHLPLKGFRVEEGAPRTLEDALKEGWTDHGLGLYCPKCSLSYLEDLAREQEQGVEVVVAGDLLEVVDAQILRGLVSTGVQVSDDTIDQFVKMYSSQRLNRFRVSMGLEPISLYQPTPKDEAQAEEFVTLGDAIRRASTKEQA